MSFAQGTTFTYQGQMTDNGTNFTGAGQFKFALVISTNANHTAAATADIPSNDYITGYQIIDGGNGYLAVPAVTVSGGGGSGAGGVAVISGGVVTGITVANTGNGQYTSAPTVTIAPPPASIAYTTYWSNDGTSTAGNEPMAAVGVPVADDLFTALLGDTTLPNMIAIDASLCMVPNLQLRMKLSSLAGVERWILGWGGDAVALKPQELLVNVRTAAEQILRSSPSKK